MDNIVSLLMAPSVWPYSILLGLILLYWLTVFVGALDLDFLDFDLDSDVDADVDMDVDADVDADAEAGLGWLGETLTFYNIGRVPFMIFLSVLVLFLWVGAALAFSFFPETKLLFLLALVPNVLVALFLTKGSTAPFRAMHGKMTQTGTAKRDLVGKIGEVILAVKPGRQGRIEVKTDGETFVLDVTTNEEEIPTGEKALIVEYHPADDQYVVSPFDL